MTVITPQRELLDRQIEVIQALRFAIGKLREAAPDISLYSTEGAFEAACAAHRGRLVRLQLVLDEIDQVAGLIADRP